MASETNLSYCGWGALRRRLGPLVEFALSKRAQLIFGFGLFGYFLVVTAWLCDDAFITFREVSNFVHGYGIRWNAHERIMAFTHPLWFFCVSLLYALTGEIYYSTIAFSGALAVVSVIMACRLAAGAPPLAIIISLLACKCVVDFMTSGLEVCLSAVLFLLLLGYLRQTRFVTYRSIFVASLLILNRYDNVLMVLPLFLTRFGELRALKWQRVLPALLPLVAWWLFAFWYFGSAVPNTFLAKVRTGYTTSELLPQAVEYFTAFWLFDPAGAICLLIGVPYLLARGNTGSKAVACGCLLYLSYLVFVGGDFMAGRLLVVPVLATLIAIYTSAPPRAVLASAILLVLLSLTNHRSTFYASRYYGIGARYGWYGGVADERAYYYKSLGFLPVIRRSPRADLRAFSAQRNCNDGEADGARLIGAAGVEGWAQCRQVKYIDADALTDPFLARLPARPNMRVGHYTRPVPLDYIASVNASKNLFRNPKLNRLYDAVVEVTQGDLLSAHRLWVIFELNFTNKYEVTLQELPPPNTAENVPAVRPSPGPA